MTRAGVLTLLPALLLGVASLLFGLPELFFVAAVCGALVLLAGASVLMRSPLLVTFAPDRRRIPAGTPLEVTVRAANGARRQTTPPVAVIDGSSDRPGAVLKLPRDALGNVPGGALLRVHPAARLAQHRARCPSR